MSTYSRCKRMLDLLNEDRPGANYMVRSSLSNNDNVFDLHQWALYVSRVRTSIIRLLFICKIDILVGVQRAKS